ncbi:MAG: hypothetical protein EAX96_06130 [Candidatus Lokiarchaeota archaeon]|nr:hypothetical protein [Candidatus Lokiarchaeota archaeon]
MKDNNPIIEFIQKLRALPINPNPYKVYEDLEFGFVGITDEQLKGLELAFDAISKSLGLGPTIKVLVLDIIRLEIGKRVGRCLAYSHPSLLIDEFLN